MANKFMEIISANLHRNIRPSKKRRHQYYFANIFKSLKNVPMSFGLIVCPSKYLTVAVFGTEFKSPPKTIEISSPFSFSIKSFSLLISLVIISV